jgi:hypothetical protein
VKAPVAAGSARRRPRRFVYVASLQPAWALIPFLDQLAPVQLLRADSLPSLALMEAARALPPRRPSCCAALFAMHFPLCT